MDAPLQKQWEERIGVSAIDDSEDEEENDWEEIEECEGRSANHSQQTEALINLILTSDLETKPSPLINTNTLLEHLIKRRPSLPKENLGYLRELASKVYTNPDPDVDALTPQERNYYDSFSPWLRSVILTGNPIGVPETRPFLCKMPGKLPNPIMAAPAPAVAPALMGPPAGPVIPAGNTRDSRPARERTMSTRKRNRVPPPPTDRRTRSQTRNENQTPKPTEQGASEQNKVSWGLNLLSGLGSIFGGPSENVNEIDYVTMPPLISSIEPDEVPIEDLDFF